MRPLDRAALATLGAAAAVAVAASAIGDRVGLQVEAVTPPPGAASVSTLTAIEVRFSEAVDRGGRAVRLAFDPAVEGSARWAARTLRFFPERPLAAGTRYTVALDGMVAAASGRRLHGEVAWSFATAALRVAYVTAGAAERTRIAARALGAAGPAAEEQEVASFERPVRDYHRSADGRALVVTLGTDAFASDLWLLDLRDGEPRELLDCGEAECSGARWSPDGTAIVYSQRRLPAPPGPWLADPSTGQTRRLLAQEVVGFEPRWSSDGDWVAFVSPIEGGLRIVNVDDGRTVLVPTRSGAPAAWRPGALNLLSSDLRRMADGRFADVVISVDLSDLVVRTPLGPAATGARAPVWAPAGDRFAFIRAAEDGEQLWLATAAGGRFDTVPILTAPRYTYREMEFAPGGGLIAAQRSRLDVPYPQPEVVVVDVAGRELVVIAAAATPRWLP